MPKDFFNSKYARPLGIVVLLLLVLFIASMQHHKGSTVTKSACGIYRQDKVVTFGKTKINAEVATSALEREKGLSGRPCIGETQGLLFVFNKPSQYSFWMKNMKFPIDIVWITSDHKVAAIEQDVKPSTYPDSFINDKRHLAQYTIELKANRSKSLNLVLGTPVKF